MADSGGAFNVVVVQFNGAVQRQKVVSVLHVTPEEVALHAADGSVRCQAAYHAKMQVRVQPLQRNLLSLRWQGVHSCPPKMIVRIPN